MYEARDLVKNVVYVDKNQRELDRYKLYVAVQSNSKKKFTPQEILELPWDNKWLNKTEFEYDEQEDKEYADKANSIADMLNKGKLSFESTNIAKELEKKDREADKNISN